jgi:hypothetical protein
MRQFDIKKQTERIGTIWHFATGLQRQSEEMAKQHAGIWGVVAGSIILSICGLLLSTGAFAQEFRGTISGTVTDPTGAVVPGASIEVMETRTGTINRTTSDAAGQYVAPFLPPGDYSITATKPGFETFTRTGITLQAQEHPIIDLALAIGNASQTVTVTGEAPLVDQENASVGQVISTQSVEDLPLNGRTPVVLAELSVGVVTTSAPGITHPFDNNAANSWSIGGTPNQVSEVLLDGSPDLTMLGAQAYSPTQDTVQEVSVRPFDTDASFGHTIGGVINQVTKSGTNELHGTMYEFNQIPNIDANLDFNSAYWNKGIAKPTPTFHFNQYGLSAGGPVWIPKVFNGKNKLFFFFAWEGLKDNTPATQITTVPTDAERQGDFSALLATSAGGASNQLYIPGTGTLSGGKFTRTAVPNNCLTNLSTYCAGVANAGLTINPVAAAYMKLYPEPNATPSPTGTNNYNSNAPSIDTYDNEFGRLDYNLSDRNHVFFDYRHNHREQVKNNYFGNNTTGTTLLRENFGSSLDDVITLNATTIFDVRLNWTFFNEVHGALSQAFSPTSVGLPSGLQTGSTEVQLPFISMGTCGSFTSFQCLGDTSSAIDPTTGYQAFTDMVKLLGKHTIKAGFDGRQYRLRVQNFGDSSGSFTFANSFDNIGTAGTGAAVGGDLASLLLGLPTSGEYDLNARADYRSYYIGTFVQDDWRVNSHLTVNLGLRFDIDTPYGEKLGRTVSGFNPAATNSASAAAATAFATTSPKDTASSNGTTVSVNASTFNTLGGLSFPGVNGGAPYAVNSGFWSPRVGFSYNPPFLHSKMVVRGGFGIFVQPETLASLAATGSYSSNALNNQEGFSASTAYAATSNSFFTSLNSLSNPFPNGYTQPAGSSLGASTFLGSPAAVSLLAPVQHDPYSERWNMGLQHTLTNSTLLEVLYVGNHATHLPVNTQNINATELQYLTTNPYTDFNLHTAVGTAVPNPFAGLLPNGTSSYNGATTSLSNLLVPYPQFGGATVAEQNETIGQSWFNSGMIHVQQRAKHGLTLTANYSFSKLLEKDTRLNDEDVQLTKRVSPFDHTHHFTVGGTYDLPFGRGKLVSFGNSKAMDEIFGGFVINSIYQFQTGAPIYFSSDLALQPGVNVRNIKSSPRVTGLAGSGNLALVNAGNIFVEGANACPSTDVCDGSVYNAAVPNANFYNHYRTFPQTLGWVRMDGFNNMDASVLKNIKFTEKANLQLRFETFNTLNHPVFAAPNVTSATSGTGGAFGYISGVPSTAQPRQVQLGGRIVF